MPSTEDGSAVSNTRLSRAHYYAKRHGFGLVVEDVSPVPVRGGCDSATSPATTEHRSTISLGHLSAEVERPLVRASSRPSRRVPSTFRSAMSEAFSMPKSGCPLRPRADGSCPASGEQMQQRCVGASHTCSLTAQAEARARAPFDHQQRRQAPGDPASLGLMPPGST